jgi:hypothetical protein
MSLLKVTELIFKRLPKIISKLSSITLFVVGEGGRNDKSSLQKETIILVFFYFNLSSGHGEGLLEKKNKTTGSVAAVSQIG